MIKDKLLKIIESVKASNIGSRIASGAFWSFTGTALAKLLVLVASIICAHILSQQEYGEFGMVRSTINMFVVFGAAGLGMTATKYISEYRESHKERIAGIYILTNGFAVVTGLIVTVVVLAIAPYLAENTLHAPHLEPSIRVGAVLLFVTILTGAQNGALTGVEDFRSMAFNTLIGSVAESAFMLLGAYYYGVLGAVLGYGVGFIALYVANFISIRKDFNRMGVEIRLSSFNREDLHLLYKFSLPAALSTILLTPTIWVIKTLLANQCGFDELAIFEAADQWKTMILFIPSTVSLVALPILSSIVGLDQTKFRKVLNINLYLNAGIALVIALAVSVLSPFIMTLYGKAYVSDYWVLIILAASTVFSSMANVVGLAISSRAKMWVGFLFNAVWAAMVIGFSVLFLNLGLGARGLALAITVAYVIHTTAQLIYIHYSGKPAKDPDSVQSCES